MGTRSHLPWICIPFVAEIDIRIISIISMAISEMTPIFETSNCENNLGENLCFLQTSYFTRSFRRFQLNKSEQ